MELFCKHHCPACSTVNWTCHGNALDDGTVNDVDVCVCWNCGEVYWLMDKDIADDIHDGNLDDAVIQKGRSHP
jgi:hypothetical protein